MLMFSLKPFLQYNFTLKQFHAIYQAFVHMRITGRTETCIYHYLLSRKGIESRLHSRTCPKPLSSLVTHCRCPANHSFCPSVYNLGRASWREETPPCTTVLGP